jgi:hypothetical protein
MVMWCGSAHRLRALIVALGLAAQVLPGAAAEPEETQALGQHDVGFATLNSAQLATMLHDKNFFFVNVHVPYEGEIRHTDAIIPFDRIANNLDKRTVLSERPDERDRGGGVVAARLYTSVASCRWNDRLEKERLRNH